MGIANIMFYFSLDDSKSQLDCFDDKLISFNIQRSDNNYLSFPRHVVIMPCKEQNRLLSPANMVVIPGITENRESDLFNELKQITKWRLTQQYSFKISSQLFSFLWRFKISDEAEVGRLKWMASIEDRDNQQIKAAYKKYQNHLKHTLTSGQIYLIPDRDVTFNQSNRKKKKYARYVFLIKVNKDQVFFMPLTTKVNRIDRKTDIIFDSHYQGEPLNRNTLPVVESFPYKIFNKKNALIVRALQQKEKQSFLNIALFHWQYKKRACKF
jgi:hypothetical protein